MRRLTALVLLLCTAGCGYKSPAAPSTTLPVVDLTAPSSLSVGAQIGQGAEAGHATVSALVRNIRGTNLSSVPVTFSTDAGTLSAESAVTDSDGLATVTLTAAQAATVVIVAGALHASQLVASEPRPADPLPSVPPVLAPPPPPSVPPTPVPTYTVTLAASPSTLAAGNSSTLTATVTATNGAPSTPTSFDWDCDGDGTAEVTNSLATHTCLYSTVGSIVSKVTVSGGPASARGAVTVTVAGPVITLNCTPHAGKIVDCAVSATLSGAPVASGSITIGGWDFGDSSTVGVVANSASHTYALATTYTVRAIGVTVPSSTASVSASAVVTVLQ